MNTRKKLKHKLWALLLISFVILCAMAINTFAGVGDSYNLATNTYYLNPDTGTTDDGGTANSALGEGMCRSAVYESAKITENSSDYTINMTMLLYSNLSNIRIAVQQQPKGEYTPVDYTILSESSSKDSAELQFNIPNPDSLIQITMYVTPMSRDVRFYMNCDTSTIVTEDTTEVTTESQASNSAFSDINGHWAESAIEKAVSMGLFSGTSATEFSPDSPMTRGMFVTVLGRLSGETITGTANFSDVSNDAYYAPYIGWANSKGIVSGTSSTTFNPDSPVTCEQAAIILVKYSAYKGVVLEEKSISPSTSNASSWALENVITAGKSGIITRQNTNGYDYTSSATRADVASMLSNYVEYYGQ